VPLAMATAHAVQTGPAGCFSPASNNSVRVELGYPSAAEAAEAACD